MTDESEDLARKYRTLKVAAKVVYDLLEYHADDDADSNDTDPEDGVAYTNGIARRILREGLGGNE